MWKSSLDFKKKIKKKIKKKSKLLYFEQASLIHFDILLYNM